MRILREGMKGDDVRRWQEFLNGQGLGVGAADGNFGNRTFQATVQFQRRHGLGSDGVVGNNTLNKAKELGFDEGGGAAPSPTAPTPSAPPSAPPADTPASIGPFNEQALAQIMPNLKADKRALYYPFLVAAMVEFEITTPLRIAAFVAQLAHESAEFRFMEEIWGPTAAQKRYEGRKDLGNTQPGDGFRFKGRGPIQITGRANYTKYGNLLGIDLVDNPALAATPEVGFRTAGLYWKMNNCNPLADQQKFISITKAINGGTNGLEDRQKYYERAKRVLGVATRGLPSDDTQEVGRGFTRGLDEPGETTPTAAERNAEESAAAPAASASDGASEASAKKSAAKQPAAKKSAVQRTTGSKGVAKGAAKKAAAKRSAGQKGAAARPAAKKGADGRGATWSGAKKAAKSGAKKSGATRGGASGAKKAAKKSAGGSKKAASKKTSRAAGAGKKGAGKSAARKGAAKKGAKGRGR